MIRVYLGLGTNLGDRLGHMERALSLLMCRPGIRLLRVSSLYETEPVGVQGSWFLNAVAEMETSLVPQDLLKTLWQVEEACGRPPVRQRGEARVMDVDMLLYGDRVLTEPNLQVPHPQMHLRRFVVVPLAELNPGLVHPRLGIRIDDLLAGLPSVPEVRVMARDWFFTRAQERCFP